MVRLRIGICILYALVFYTVAMLISCMATADVPVLGVAESDLQRIPGVGAPAMIVSARKRSFAAPSLVTVLDQPMPESREYSLEEISACVPVGEMAMKMTKLQRSGHDREFVEGSIKKHLDGGLALWVAPIAELVFSNAAESSEKVVKEAIRYCLRTMKWHNKMKEGFYL